MSRGVLGCLCLSGKCRTVSETSCGKCPADKGEMPTGPELELLESDECKKTIKKEIKIMKSLFKIQIRD